MKMLSFTQLTEEQIKIRKTQVRRNGEYCRVPHLIWPKHLGQICKSGLPLSWWVTTRFHLPKSLVCLELPHRVWWIFPLQSSQRDGQISICCKPANPFASNVTINDAFSMTCDNSLQARLLFLAYQQRNCRRITPELFMLRFIMWQIRVENCLCRNLPFMLYDDKQIIFIKNTDAYTFPKLIVENNGESATLKLRTHEISAPKQTPV